jgi:hypothetical protein
MSIGKFKLISLYILIIRTHRLSYFVFLFAGCYAGKNDRQEETMGRLGTTNRRRGTSQEGTTTAAAADILGKFFFKNSHRG